MEPQRGLVTGTTSRLSRKVVPPVRGAVPYPHLSDNTLVLSDLLLLAPLDNKLYLQFRLAFFPVSLSPNLPPGHGHLGKVSMSGSCLPQHVAFMESSC